MRWFITFVVVVFCNMILLHNSHSAGLIDEEGIESSRAGLHLRQSSRFVSVLVLSNEGWMEENLNEDRWHCQQTKFVLEGAKWLLNHNRLNSKSIRRLVELSGMPDVCLMWASNSQKADEEFPILLSPQGDVVFVGGDRGPYVPWASLNHLSWSLDTLAVDDMTVRGIAPAGVGLSKKEYVTVGTQQMKVERYWPPQVLPSTAPIPPSR